MSSEDNPTLHAASNGGATTVVQYLDKVKELIPAEVSAAFLAINSAIPLNDTTIYWVYSFFFVLLILCALYMKIKSKSIPQMAFVTFIAFPVWALNISLARFEFLSDKTWLPACALFIVTATSPLITLLEKQEPK
jgi:hypothetical protein